MKSICCIPKSTSHHTALQSLSGVRCLGVCLLFITSCLNLELVFNTYGACRSAATTLRTCIELRSPDSANSKTVPQAEALFKT